MKKDCAKYKRWKAKNTTVQEEQTHQIEIQPEEITETPRISLRTTISKSPKRLIDEIHMARQEIKEPRTYEKAILSKKKDEWIKAMNEKMQSLEKNGTWQLTNLPDDRKAVGSKWVYKIKGSNDGSIQNFKARVVAQGFSQKFGTDYNEVFAPVVRQATFRTLLSVAAKEKLLVEHLDVKTAFFLWKS